MTYAGWVAIWNSAVAQIGHAPFFIQLATWLGLAFAVTMCLEGIRVSLLPRRWLAPRMARSPFAVTPRMDHVSVQAPSAIAAPRSLASRDKPLPGKVVPSRQRVRRMRKKVIGVKRITKPIKHRITRYPADPAPPAMEPFELSTSDIASEPM